MAKKNERPWGQFTNLRVLPPHCKVKEIVVNPGHRLSLQRHEWRAEWWYTHSGNGIAILEEDGITTEYALMPGSMNYIPAMAWHRIDNTLGNEPLVIIEIQSGEVCDEADIERKSDDYGRSE